MLNRINTRVRSSADAGFTLVEMLIVIVILGILTGIAAFSLGAFKAESTAVCDSASAEVTATAAEAAANSATGKTASDFAGAKDCT